MATSPEVPGGTRGYRSFIEHQFYHRNESILSSVEQSHSEIFVDYNATWC